MASRVGHMFICDNRLKVAQLAGKLGGSVFPASGAKVAKVAIARSGVVVKNTPPGFVKLVTCTKLSV